MPSNGDKRKRKFGIGMLTPLLFNKHFSDRDDDKDLEDGPLPSGPDAANYGNANISERILFIMDAVVRDAGEVWNVHSDVWGGKNRYGVVRRFRGEQSRRKAQRFAKTSTYSKKDKSIPKDVEKLQNDKTSIRKTTTEDRNYKQEYERYHAQPEQKKRRAQRNNARRKMERTGRVKKGDGKDVHHRNRNTSDNESQNLSVMSKSKNRSLNQ